MEITKDIFFRFLKDNDFYDAWIEGYNLDNEIYQDEVPLDEFFSKGKVPTHLWLYYGPAALAMLAYIKGDASDNQTKRYFEWRKKYMSQYSELDQKWMDYVRRNQ